MQGGILNVCKPGGPTSHDVVMRVRRMLNIRQVGHAGTLDPMAQGVLLTCVGPATRLVEYLHALPKEYRAGVRFGEVSDTQDATGQILQRQDASGLTRPQVEATIAAFTGLIRQVPPMFSAVKQQGRPLYERARRGETVERAPREVQIYALELEAFTQGPDADAVLSLRCSSGTYVRTLCHDLGRRLGTGAVMTSLTRTAIGPCQLGGASTLEELQRRVDSGGPLPWVPYSQALAHLAARTVSCDEIEALRHGRPLTGAGNAAGAPVALFDESGELLGIGDSVGAEDGGRVRPVKVFIRDDASN